ncbi:Fanconi anemia group A protein [Lampris incognitus]|uniref:Fanconi anemia group A protein n=1 Tax=Lampris incognitus TaxID=2546036 RepID=UPI0024B4D3F2|nr:Fanconi anemia group A protein [Lampris incognitus]
MSSSTSCDTSQKRTLTSLLAGRVVKQPKQEDVQGLQEAAIHLLNQHLNLSSLLLEVGENAEQKKTPDDLLPAISGSLLESELRRQAGVLGIPVVGLSVKLVLDRLKEITAAEEEDKRTVLLPFSQRVQLCTLLQSTKELLSLGSFCPKLFWQEYWKDKKQPKLEVVHHLHSYNILSFKYILERAEGIKSWLVSELKALCSWTAPQVQQEEKQIRQEVLSTVLAVLVGTGFEDSLDLAAPNKRTCLLCSSVMDDMLSWLLDTLDKTQTQQSDEAAAVLWIQLFDASLCGVYASPESLHRFFKQSLTYTLTYKPRLKVSDAIAKQNEWSFAKISRLLTSLFHKLAVIFSIEELLCHLEQVLETHEVNWKNVLSFLSALLVYNPNTQAGLRDLLSRLLSLAFQSYDSENIVTAFLLARQGALEGPSFFPSYSDWFKMSFGGVSGYHGSSKKSLVFLLKFLSDLVPYDPPHYLKVHILHPPYVAVKHRSLLLEYVSLAKTRLTDLKVSVEDMGIYEDVSGAPGAPVQPQCQALQDVEKAVSLFENTGRISATVMEASIFRRPYFLTRFLPALLTPRVLPVTADSQMSFIEALKKADKIPAAQYSCYIESCQKQRQQDMGRLCMENDNGLQEVLRVQLQELQGLTVDGNEGEILSQLSRISHTLSVIFPDGPGGLIGQTVIKLNTDPYLCPELHVKVVNMILRNFCQCMLDTSKTNPPNKQSPWAAQYVSVLLDHTQLVSVLVHRLWDLFRNQGSSLSAAHVLGLAAFVVHLHATSTKSSLVQMSLPQQSKPVCLTEALGSALLCTTHTSMSFCLRFCVAALCYGICIGDSVSQLQLDHIPINLYKKLLYLIPRLVPEARRTPVTSEYPRASVLSLEENLEDNHPGLWRITTDTNTTWRKSAWQLWQNTVFRQLVQQPEHQLFFSEWLATELKVKRNEDALSDPERQEYQQWACMAFYLSRPVELGGCGGDMRNLCSHIVHAIMDQQLCGQSQVNPEYRISQTGTCLPDILSRLQELVFDMELTGQSSSRRREDGVLDFLLMQVSQRCSSSLTSDPQSISPELSLQHTMQTWNRVLLALPSVLFVKVKNEGGRTTLDCHTLIQHVNQDQRKVCSPAGLLPYHLTAHFLRGIFNASIRCGQSSGEVNKAWSQISLHCPLLLVSTVHWWDQLSPMLASLWHRLCAGEPLPEKLQLVADCLHWACSSSKSVPAHVPSAPALLFAASLHCAWKGAARDREMSQGFKTILEMLGQKKEKQNRQVLVFLLFLCIIDLLSFLLCPQEEESCPSAKELCADILTVLIDFPDWLLIFKSPKAEPDLYQSVTLVAPGECTRLMPWAFYSLLLKLSPETLERAVNCPGFLHTAVLCYINLIQLFLDGKTPNPITEPDGSQMEPLQILSRAQHFLLTTISQTSSTILSSNIFSQLGAQCAELDPQVAAALSLHRTPNRLSPEMDFL